MLVLYLHTYVSDIICLCILNVFAPTYKYILIFLSTYLGMYWKCLQIYLPLWLNVFLCFQYMIQRACLDIQASTAVNS